MAIHYRTCPLCEAMCGLAIEVDGKEIESIRGDKEDPLSRGYICPKAVALKDIQEDPDRLKEPMRRTTKGWEPVAWDEALDEVAARIKSVRKEFGDDALAIYLGNPTIHNLGSLTFGLPFLRTLKTRNRFSATSADQLPRAFSSLMLFGTQFLFPIPDVDRTDFMILFGANPVVSNGSLMSAPGFGRRMKAIQERGGRVVVVDPRRTETARLADQHIFIRPGSDALFLMGMLHTLFEEKLDDPGVLADILRDLPVVRASVAPYAPERVAKPTGVEAETIRALARDFAKAPSAVCYGRMGISTQEFGGLANYFIDILNIVTGNLDRPGGAMFTKPAVDVIEHAGFAKQKGHFNRWKTRVRGLPEFGGEAPVAAMAEEMETEGDGQIRALITVAGNPVLSIPNGARLERALDRLDFMVSIDFYLNETTSKADIILPPTAPLEHDHYDLALNLLAVRNVARYAPPLFAREGYQRHDWEIFNGLTARLTSGEGWFGKKVAHFKERIGARIGPRGMLDLALRLGPYGRWRVGRRGLSLKVLENAPHGLDLGPLQPALPRRLGTSDGLIHLAPKPMLDDLRRLEFVLESFGEEKNIEADQEDNDTLLLIGRRELRSNNSWMHNSRRLVKGKARCRLLIHPHDASRRSISDGMLVEVVSEVGSLVVPATLSEEVMPGVVSLPHGWGHHRQGIRLKVAQAHAGVSINDITSERFIDKLTGNAAFNGLPVKVWAGRAASSPPAHG